MAKRLSIAVVGGTSGPSSRIGRTERVLPSENRLPARFVLPAVLKPALQKPFGELFSEPGAARNAAEFIRRARPSFIAVVGDVTFENLHARSVSPDLVIVDGKTLRTVSGIPVSIPKVAIHIRSPRGQITRELVLAVRKAVSENVGKKIPQSIIVDGEEDLAVIPVILALPLGSMVLYGQPKKGIVGVVVDENAKKKASDLLLRFRRLP